MELDAEIEAEKQKKKVRLIYIHTHTHSLMITNTHDSPLQALLARKSAKITYLEEQQLRWERLRAQTDKAVGTYGHR